MLSRQAILDAQDLKTVDVDVPEWGDTIRLRMLSAAERFAVNEAGTVDGKFDAARYQTAVIAATAVNEDGTRLFEDQDAYALAAKSSGAIERIFAAAAKLNGMGPKSTDDAEKNS